MKTIPGVGGRRQPSLVLARFQAAWLAVVFGLPGLARAADPFAEALDIDTPPLSFTHSGNAPWLVQTALTRDGIDAVQSGDIGPNETSVLTTQVTGPCYLTFHWRTSCEAFGGDNMEVSVDGISNYQISGTWDRWTQGPELAIPAGTHAVAWTYRKDASGDVGDDCAYVDNLVITPASPPANDNFANRTDLGSAASVSVPGDNRFSSTEPGEDTYSIHMGSSGASVWWSWTAPASGWAHVEISELDGYFVNGLVAVYTGTGIGSLTRVGWSEMDGLTFPTVAGQTYQIMMQGRSFMPGQPISMGPFTLDLTHGTTVPPLVLTGLSITPDPANVGSGQVTVTLDLTVSSNNPCTAGSFELIRPNQPWGETINFSATDRVSGNDTLGTYEVTYTVPAYSPPGVYAIERVQLRSSTGESVTCGRNSGSGVTHVFGGAGIDYALQVDNSGPTDTTPPQVQSLVITPDPVNIHSGAQTITLDFAMTDDLSGLGGGWAYVYKPDGNWGGSITFPDTPLSGTPNNGVYRCTFQVPADAPTGTWTVNLSTEDLLGNHVMYGGTGNPPFPHGTAENSFVVKNTASGNDYTAWAGTYFAPEELATIGALDADPDHDGCDNGVEAALGTHPRQSNSRGATSFAQNSSGGNHLTISFLRAENLPSNLTLLVRTATGLHAGVVWSTLSQKTGSGAWSDPSVVTEGTAVDGKVPVTVHAPVGSGQKLFIQLQVGQAGP